MKLIEIQNLCKAYEKKNVFDNLNMMIPEKGIVLLKGQNGTGKSTILKILSKMVKYEAGIINYNDPLFFQKSAFLLDIPIMLDNLNFKDNMNLVGSLLKMPKEIVQTSIFQYQKIFNLPTNTLYGNYSLGMKKKAEIARTLIYEPEYIFWDEPFNSLDNESIDTIFKIVDHSKLFFIISHEDYFDKIADEIIRL